MNLPAEPSGSTEVHTRMESVLPVVHRESEEYEKTSTPPSVALHKTASTPQSVTLHHPACDQLSFTQPAASLSEVSLPGRSPWIFRAPQQSLGALYGTSLLAPTLFGGSHPSRRPAAVHTAVNAEPNIDNQHSTMRTEHSPLPNQPQRPFTALHPLQQHRTFRIPIRKRAPSYYNERP